MLYQAIAVDPDTGGRSDIIATSMVRHHQPRNELCIFPKHRRSLSRLAAIDALSISENVYSETV